MTPTVGGPAVAAAVKISAAEATRSARIGSNHAGRQPLRRRLERAPERAGWQWNRLDVGERLGAELFGASVYEIEPGQKTFPYHWQYVEEELLIVLDGEPTLRSPGGEQRLIPDRHLRQGPASVRPPRGRPDYFDGEE